MAEYHNTTGEQIYTEELLSHGLKRAIVNGPIRGDTCEKNIQADRTSKREIQTKKSNRCITVCFKLISRANKTSKTKSSNSNRTFKKQQEMLSNAEEINVNNYRKYTELKQNGAGSRQQSPPPPQTSNPRQSSQPGLVSCRMCQACRQHCYKFRICSPLWGRKK